MPEQTEHEAFLAYSQHLGTCDICQPSRGALCTEGLKLFRHWERLDQKVRQPVKEIQR